MLGRTLLAVRLVAASLRRRPVEAIVTVVAIAATTTTLTLGLALHGVTNHPYQTTRATTSGPDVVVMPTTHPTSGPGSPAENAHPGSEATDLAALEGLVHAPGVATFSGPYPVSFPTMRVNGSKVIAVAEGRTTGRAAVDQPYVTQGSWVRPGGVVVERSFADELNVQVGDRVTLNGRSFPVVGIAVTAAVPPYPYTVTGVALDTLPAVWSQALGLIWTTEPTARSLATPSAPLSYMLNLKLVDPSQAAAFVDVHAGDHRLYFEPWQRVSEVESQATVPFQRGLLIGERVARSAGRCQLGGDRGRSPGGTDPPGRPLEGGRCHPAAGGGGAPARVPHVGVGRRRGGAGPRMVAGAVDRHPGRRTGRERRGAAGDGRRRGVDRGPGHGGRRPGGVDPVGAGRPDEHHGRGWPTRPASRSAGRSWFGRRRICRCRCCSDCAWRRGGPAG